MTQPLNSGAQRFQAALAQAGWPHRVVELPHSTRTAVEAAQAVGCTVAQIVKSLIFQGTDTGRALLVVASGVNRVDEARLAALAGEPVARPAADFVRQQTGYAIGGVPPLGHPAPLATYIDADLLTHADLWAAAGSPTAVFRLAPADLVAMTGGHVVQIA